MKYLKSFIPAIAVLTLLQACTKEYITKQYITQEYNGAQVYARDFTVKPGDWQQNYDDGYDIARSDNYLWAEFDDPDITQDAVDNGTVQAFIFTKMDDIESWNPLPFVYPLEITIKDSTTGKTETIIVPENTRIEYNVGKVTFILQDLDGFNPEDITNDMTIKVCVTI